LKFPGGVGGAIYSDPSPFTMTVGVVYTFSFWYKQNNSTQSSFSVQNQGGSGDMNGNFIFSVTTNPSQTWQRISWTFTNVTNKVYFIITPMTTDSEVLMTEFTLTEGSMPGGPGLTTAGNCLNWFASQTDKIVVNINYEGIVTDGLVLNLDAGFLPSFATIPSNANSSTVTPWYDISGNANNGTLTNGPTYSSANSGSIVFDGVDDYVTIPYQPSLGLSTQGSINIWCYPTTLSQGLYAGLLGMTTSGTGGGQSYYIHWRKANNTISAAIQNNGTYNVIETPLPTSISWYNFTFTWNGSFLNLYQNGVSVSSPVSQTINAQALTSSVNVGGRMFGNDGGNQGYFAGYIPTSQLYNRALSASEVLQNYNAQKGRFGL
jgi:hypothetical protein